MKRTCPFCGFSNQAASPACSQCGADLPPPSRGQRPCLKFLWLLPPLLTGAFLAQACLSAKTPAAHLAAAPATNAPPDVEHLLATNLARLSDPEVLSGKVAAARHADEWARRRAHDPAFANTLIEHTLLKLQRIGQDEALTPEESLRRVAEMVLPIGSRVEVTRAQTGRFAVRAAFRLAAFTRTDSFGATHHTSVSAMRQDIEDATARVMKDLFDYCGARGIESISVSCNSVVSETTKDPLGKEEKISRHRSLYRAILDFETASSVASWRDITLASVKRLMKIDRDLTPTLIITAPQTDRRANFDEPLEF